jgi:hypothetical protein
MTKEDIFQSGFVTAFINEYFNEQIHIYYPDKVRLLYTLCESEEEKQKVTKEQINNIKTKIPELGFEELSLGYLQSCNPESLQNYIEPNQRFEFWLKRFSVEFDYNTLVFNPITKAILEYNEVDELTVEVLENEDEFWEWYPKSESPKIREFLSIITSEADILSLIEYNIKKYQENEYWEFDFEEYQRYIDVNKPIEILFSLCELLVQLNRLRMFKEFLEIENPLPSQQAENIDWISTFENIDINENTNPNSYRIANIEQKKNYYSEASYNLTIQYLTSFKRETYLFNNKRKLDYINALNIENPTTTNTESTLFNQTVFEAQNNYFEFITLYKSIFENLKPQPKQKQQNDLTENPLREKIEIAFDFMRCNDPRKHKLILIETDFDKLINWVHFYFDNNFQLPKIDEPIKNINTSKGNVVYTFIKLFKDEYPSNTKPNSLFELIKNCFYDYRNDNIDNYKKQKEPQYYNELINKN